MSTEFSEGKILVTEIIEYDAILFNNEKDEERVCNFIKEHGGTIKRRDIQFDSLSPRILDEVIEFEYYGFSDYPDKYRVSFGVWILVPKDQGENRFIVTSVLPDKCIKVKGEIC